MIRIFLVEDNPMMRTLLRAVLEGPRDWAVVGEAGNGRHAVAEWNEHAPNVTVMDFMMPEMDGLEAGRKLSHEHPESPVLLVTIDPTKQLEEAAQEAGIKGLCQKADPNCVLRAVETLLRGGTYFGRAVARA